MKLTANIEYYGTAGYLAWIDNIKGLVTQADSAENAFKELIVSLKVKMAYDYGFEIDGWKDTKTDEHYKMEHEQKIDLHEGRAKKEINLCFA